MKDDPEGRDLLESLRRKECIQCGSHRLKVFFAIEREQRPPEYSHAVIAVCSECKGGQLERAYSDSSNAQESFDHTEWYLLDKNSVDRLREFIRQSSADGGLRRRCPPCAEPLSPRCLCGVHWQLSEAAKRLEALTDKEVRKHQGMAPCKFTTSGDGLPRFKRLH